LRRSSDPPDAELRSTPTRRLAPRAVLIGLVVALNLAIIIALAWAATERLHVSVTVGPNKVSSQVGQAPLEIDRPIGSKSKIGLFLQGADPKAIVYWIPNASGRPAHDLSDDAYRLGTESAWSNVTITTIDGGSSGAGVRLSDSIGPMQPAFGDWFQHPLGGLASATPGLVLFDAPMAEAYRVDADLLRPRNAAGLMVLTDDGSNGLLLYFRPENRDVMIYDVRDGRWLGPIVAIPYLTFNKDPGSAIKDVARLALGGYPAAVVLIALIVLLGFLDTMLVRRRIAARVHVQSPAVPRESWPRWLANFGAGVITLGGLGLTLYVASALLERMPHVQDSVGYLFQAKTFALGRLWVPTPAQPQFFTHEFIVMDAVGRWFSKYSPGWPALLAIGSIAGAPWVVDPILGALSLYLLYRLGREIYRPRVGLIAAALGLTSPFFIFLSGSMMSHTSGLFFTLLMAWGGWRASRSPRPLGFALLVGLAFGMLFLIRPFTAIAVGLPFAVLALLSVVRSPFDGLKRFGPAIFSATPFIVAFLAYNKALTGDWLYPPQQLWWPFDQVGFGPGHGPWGFTPIDALNNTSRNLSELLEHGLGWPFFLTLSLPMIPFVTGRIRTWDWLLLLGVLGVVGGYALWWADGIMYGPRFYYEGFGFLLLLTARGIDTALDLAGSGLFATERPARSSTVATVGVVAAVLGLVFYNASYYLPGQWDLYHGYNYVSRKKIDAAERAGIHNALVFTNVGFPYEWWEYGEVFSANDPLLQGDIIYARDLGDAADRKLIVDFPGRSVYRLNRTDLQPLDLTSAAENRSPFGVP
jgi:hypothetical protein